MGFEVFEPIRERLEARLPGVCKDLSPEARKFVLNGGKRLRPILTYVVAEALGCRHASAYRIA